MKARRRAEITISSNRKRNTKRPHNQKSDSTDEVILTKKIKSIPKFLPSLELDENEELKLDDSTQVFGKFLFTKH